MMRLRVIAIGRLGRGPETQILQDLQKRIDAMSRAIGVGPLEIRELEDKTKSGREAEADLLLGAAKGAEKIIVLDEKGESRASMDFAQDLRLWRDQGVRDAVFLLGGADGHPPRVRAAAHKILSMGAMTWPHALARVMMVEQLYRAGSILAGTPYHREG